MEKKIIFLLLSLFAVSHSQLSFSKSHVAGYPYFEVDQLYPSFSSETKKMVNTRGGNLYKEFHPEKKSKNYVYAAVEVYKNEKKVDPSAKRLFSRVDFNGDLHKSGGFVFSKFAFMMPRKNASFYTIDEQMGRENLNNLLNNLVIDDLQVNEGKIKIRRLLNIDIPVFGGEKVIPLKGRAMFFNGDQFEGNKKLHQHVKKVRSLDQNLRQRYSYDEMYITARATKEGDLIRGVSAFLTYYHISSDYDFVVGYELGRMDKIPQIPFVTKKIVDRLENRNRMEIANLIYKYNL